MIQAGYPGKEFAMKKKIICLLAVLALCFSAMTVLASEESSITEQASALYDAGDYEAAIPLLQEAAEKGDPAAQNKLGNCYFNGWGVEKNYEEAMKYPSLGVSTISI